jgi:predicted RNase H-like nuclease (RuvC/YqgF family)
MDTKNQSANNTPTEKKKQPLGLIILLVILLITASVLAYVYFDLRKKSLRQEEDLVRTEQLKDSLEIELTSMIEDYELMKVENDSINVLLEVQQNYIRGLLKKETNNKEKIRLYEKELKTLREIMRSYIVQIDSLNTQNIALTAENVEIKSKLEKTQNEREQLKQEKEQLNTKVEKASVLNAKDIMVSPLNKNSKERDKAKTIEKIKTCFTIRENAIAQAGTKTVYLRIYRPDGFLMTPSAENVFETNEGTLIFSAKRDVEYENQDIEMCIFYDKTEEFVEGDYTLELYAEGNKIGESVFTLR